MVGRHARFALREYFCQDSVFCSVVVGFRCNVSVFCLLVMESPPLFNLLWSCFCKGTNCLPNLKLNVEHYEQYLVICAPFNSSNLFFAQLFIPFHIWKELNCTIRCKICLKIISGSRKKKKK